MSKSEILDLPPPNAVESERALLAGFHVRGRVDPDCDLQAIQFYDGRNGAMYSAMSDLEGELGEWTRPHLSRNCATIPRGEGMDSTPRM